VLADVGEGNCPNALEKTGSHNLQECEKHISKAYAADMLWQQTVQRRLVSISKLLLLATWGARNRIKRTMTITAMMDKRLVRSRDERSFSADKGSIMSSEAMKVTNLRFVSRPCPPHCANTAGTVSPESLGNQQKRGQAEAA
jgi:hypothetical protein